MSLPIYQVDAFSGSPFRGNPAGVCLLEPSDRSDFDVPWMQAVAQEMNLSETAFLASTGQGYALRWFTPTTEVELCGHATLASAHVLWSEGLEPEDRELRFATASGPLTARRAGPWIELDFPALPALPLDAPGRGEEVGALLRALGLESARLRWAGDNGMDYLLEVDAEATLLALAPDFRLLKGSSDRGVIVTAPSAREGFDFVSRFFAPAAGIDEDPVTGSAHCCLGPHWAATLGKQELVGYQASSRGGIVRVRPQGDRVLLAGEAVTVIRGRLA